MHFDIFSLVAGVATGLASGLGIHLLRRAHARQQLGSCRTGLVQAEGRLNALYENAVVGMFQSTPDGEFLSANTAMAHMLGYDSTGDMLSNLHLADHIYFEPVDRERMSDFIRSEGAVVNYEIRMRRKSGKAVWVLMNIRLAENALGEEVFEGIAVDNTARKVAELRFKNREAKYRRSVETAAEAFILTNSRGYIADMNSAACSMLGRSRSELRGASPAEFMDATTREFLRYKARSLQRGQRLRFEGGVINHDGVVVPVLVNLTPLREKGGRLAGHVAFISDLTEQRRAEKLREEIKLREAEKKMFEAEKLASLGRLMAGVAHEINNPNNFIYFNLPVLQDYIREIGEALREMDASGDTELLGQSLDTALDDLNQIIVDMEHGSSRITEIVSRLKTYVREQQVKDMKPADLGAVVTNATSLVEKEVRKMVKTFEVEVGELPPVEMHSGRIEQVLINLVLNAGQAADKEDSWVRLQVRHLAEDDEVEVRVADNGRGISRENMDQIFEPFFTTRGGETPRGGESGTGLGLFITHRIIEEHNGFIGVESAGTQGTVFTVRLPVRQREETHDRFHSGRRRRKAFSK